METTNLKAYLESQLPAYLQNLQQMVAVNSFTENPDGVNALGELTGGLFSALEFDQERVPSTNASFGDHFIFSRRGSSGPAIGLVSHLDTVFPPEEEIANHFSWRQEGNKIYGPGTVDIKGGTAMILLILEAFRKYSPQLFDRTDWIVLLNSSEERLSEDFGRIARQRLDSARAALVFEGGFYNNSADDFRLVSARKGMAHFQVQVHGHSSHAGVSHENGANAVRQLAELITRIEGLTDYEKGLTVNVGVVRGGVVTNRVPHFAEALLEMRAFDEGIFEDAAKQLTGLSGEGSVTTREGHPCRISVELQDTTPPWPENPGTQTLLDIWQHAGESLGFTVTPEPRGGLSDGNQIWRTVPTLDALGPGGGGAHQSEHDPAHGKTQEYIYVPSIVPKALLNIVALQKLLAD